MNTMHIRQKNLNQNTLSEQDISTNNMDDISPGIVITEDENLWTDLLILAATVKLTLQRGNSFQIWHYWNGDFPLFLEPDFAVQLPDYWKSRPHLWIVFTESQKMKYPSLTLKFPTVQQVVLPNDITDFIRHFSQINANISDAFPRKRIPWQGIFSRKYSLNRNPESLGRDKSAMKVDIESIAILGAHGGAGVSLLAFMLGYLLHENHNVVYIDIDGTCDAASIGVQKIPSISVLHQDPTSVTSQILAGYPQSFLGFHLADGSQVFDSEIEFHDFIHKLGDASIFPIFDLGKVSHSLLQKWCLTQCAKILLLSRGYPRSAISISRAKKLYPQVTFIVIILGKFHCGINRALFEQMAQAQIYTILPWNARINFSYHTEKLKIPAGFLRYVSAIIE